MRAGLERNLVSRSARRTARPRFDVIVPVHTPESDVLLCLSSVIAARTATPFELIVIDDATPFEGTRILLRELAAKGLIKLLVNDRNLGFVASANRGLTLHADRDVILLNADTCVYDGWVDRLAAVLDGDARIGTVTPLSNAATILSYPFTLMNNIMDLEIKFRELDQLVAHLDLPPVEIPTGIGFCMAMRRACIADVGLFDVERFGLGYGEENDFSRRAVQRGWKNFVAANTFVWHREGSSFGTRRAALVLAAQANVEAAHPGYASLIAAFIGEDPLRPVRERIDLERLRNIPCAKIVRPRWSKAIGGNAENGLEISFAREGWRSAKRRMAVRGAIALPNLPLIDSHVSAEQLAVILTRAGVERVELRKWELLGGFERRLIAAAVLAAIPLGISGARHKAPCERRRSGIDVQAVAG